MAKLSDTEQIYRVDDAMTMLAGWNMLCWYAPCNEPFDSESLDCARARQASYIEELADRLVAYDANSDDPVVQSRRRRFARGSQQTFGDVPGGGCAGRVSVGTVYDEYVPFQNTPRMVVRFSDAEGNYSRDVGILVVEALRKAGIHPCWSGLAHDPVYILR